MHGRRAAVPAAAPERAYTPPSLYTGSTRKGRPTPMSAASPPGRYGFAHLKGKLLDVDLRVPMIIRAPGALRGRVSQPVELVDMYPTICDLAGIPCPPRRRGGGGGGGQPQRHLASLASEGQRDQAWDEPPLDGRSLLPHIMTRWDDVHDPAGADAHWANSFISATMSVISRSSSGSGSSSPSAGFFGSCDADPEGQAARCKRSEGRDHTHR